MKRCHCSPPAKYRRLGATRPEHYAFPECFMYPLYFTSPAQSVKHIRAAASYFAKHAHRYPKAEQRKIARRIDAAKRKFGIGEYRQKHRGVVSLEAARRRRKAPRRHRKAA